MEVQPTIQNNEVLKEYIEIKFNQAKKDRIPSVQDILEELR